jgi:protein-S-isoprenylcysteine O-methyltransferase Ste14
MRIDLPSAILSMTLSAYWAGVAITALVNRWQHGRSAGIWPSSRAERFLWPTWVPVIVLWNVLPWLALSRSPNWLLLRFLAALLGAGCFVATVVCWMQLGKNWSMAVVPGQKTELVQTGPYALVRHPIYALSIALMLCSVVVVPTRPMLTLAVLHLSFLWIKARNEEQFLHVLHGRLYTDYCGRTGRFVPSLMLPARKKTHAVRSLGRTAARSGRPSTPGNAPN